jgi:N-acetylglucosamine malate deacetylase 2
MNICFYLLTLAILLLGCLWFLRSNLQDDSIPDAEDFTGERVMFIFPHPDDEITCAGTIKNFHILGNETILITFTRGELGTTNGLIEEDDPIARKVKLGRLRTQELESVGKLLEIDRLEILDFPDSGIKDIPKNAIAKVIEEKIQQYQPTILITYDDRIGFYGHPDHYLTARYTKEIFLQQRDRADFPVKKLYQVTMPKPMVRVALKISDYFRQSYEQLTTEGLPEPSIAVNISKFGKYKRDAMLLHRSQKPTFDEMQPYFDIIPPFVYFRIFDKEYFSLVK